MEGVLIVELKTAKALAPEHEAQVLGYLKSSRMEHGLLINFGSSKFAIRKYIWSEDKTVDNHKERESAKRIFPVNSASFMAKKI